MEPTSLPVPVCCTGCGEWTKFCECGQEPIEELQLLNDEHIHFVGSYCHKKCRNLYLPIIGKRDFCNWQTPSGAEVFVDLIGIDDNYKRHPLCIEAEAKARAEVRKARR